MRKWLWRLGIFAALAATLFILKVTVFAAKPIPVETAVVTRGTVRETVTNIRAGTVKARLRSDLSPETAGRVVALPYRQGDHAERGAVLLRLDDSEQRAQLDVARRDLEVAEAGRSRACASAERAAQELARTARLAAEQIVSADALDAARTSRDAAVADCRGADAAIERARAAVRAARAALDRTVLRAPFDGIVAKVETEVGEWTTPAPPGVPIPPVIDFLDPATIYVSAPMDEVDSARIHPGQRVIVTVDSFRDRTLAGRVTDVAPYVLDVEQQNRTVEVRVALEDESFAARLLPGTSADVEIVLEVHDDVPSLPTRALLEGDKVLVVDDGRLVERSVEVGLRNWDTTEIVSGLAVGDRVVTSLDRPEVKAGARVRVVEKLPAEAA